MTTQKINVTLHNGLSSNSACRFIQAATQFHSEIQLTNGSNSVNAKSLLGVLSLEIKKGDTIIIAANGPDEAESVTTLSKMFL